MGDGLDGPQRNAGPRRRRSVTWGSCRPGRQGRVPAGQVRDRPGQDRAARRRAPDRPGRGAGRRGRLRRLPGACPALHRLRVRLDQAGHLELGGLPHRRGYLCAAGGSGGGDRPAEAEAPVRPAPDAQDRDRGARDAAPRRPAARDHRAQVPVTTMATAAEAGDGPLVLLLHGFPEFWWTWRHQLAVLPGAGFRAVAVDLRGYGGSDKPPRGYDLVTAAADAAGLIRALGEANAIVIGHGLGGLVAWTLAAYYPKVVRRLAVISMAHPLRMRASVFTDPFGQGRRTGYALGFQLPVLPERQLLRDGAVRVGRLLEKWSAPGWPDPETEHIYARAMRIPSVAHSALEYHRWLARSGVRPDGLRYARQMRTAIVAPVLHLHGALDSCVLPRTARGAGRYVEDRKSVV